MIKNNKFFIFFLFFYISFCYPQKVNLITYNVDIKKKLNSSKDSSNYKQFEQKTNKLEKLTEDSDFVLYFDDNASFFEETKKMEVETNLNKRNFAFKFVNGTWYSNLKDSIKIKQKSFAGDSFNIYYPMNSHNWEISNESRTISGYICYKATASKTETNIITKKEKELTTTAWFTPEIPVPFGPNGIDGLPGLILVCSQNNGTLNFFASNIKFNVDEIDIEKLLKLDKGKNITDKEYKKLILEKFKSYRN